MSSRNYEKLETDFVGTEEAEGFLSHCPRQRQPAWMGKHVIGFSYHFATVILLIVSILGNAVLVGIVMSLRTQREGRVLHPKTDYCKFVNTLIQVEHLLIPLCSGLETGRSSRNWRG